ncbi:MAG: hypothetical protein ITF99_00100 [Chryseobacterium sp.]|nr:hypothetical protein [Chryseobacterium sp.]
MSKRNYTGTISIGLQKGYTGKYYHKEEYIGFIRRWQMVRTEAHQLMFCPAVYEFDLVCGNLTEKHLALRFINYPKSLVKKKEFRETITSLARLMAEKFSQNRVLIEYTDRNILLEMSDHHDHKTGRI